MFPSFRLLSSMKGRLIKRNHGKIAVGFPVNRLVHPALQLRLPVLHFKGNRHVKNQIGVARSPDHPKIMNGQTRVQLPDLPLYQSPHVI